MTTTVAPDLKPDHTESEEWPTLDRDPTHATREELDAHSYTVVMTGGHPGNGEIDWGRNVLSRLDRVERRADRRVCSSVVVRILVL